MTSLLRDACMTIGLAAPFVNYIHVESKSNLFLFLSLSLSREITIMELDGSILSLCSNKEESGHGFIFVDENRETFPGSGKRAALEKKRKEKKRKVSCLAFFSGRKFPTKSWTTHNKSGYYVSVTLDGETRSFPRTRTMILRSSNGFVVFCATSVSRTLEFFLPFFSPPLLNPISNGCILEFLVIKKKKEKRRRKGSKHGGLHAVEKKEKLSRSHAFWICKQAIWAPGRSARYRSHSLIFD